HSKDKSLRQEALEEIHHVKWIPAWGEDRMYEMIEKRRTGASRASASGACLSSFFIVKVVARASKISKRWAMSSNGLKRKAPTPGTSTRRKNCSLLAPLAPAARQSGARKMTFSTCGSIPALRT